MHPNSEYNFMLQQGFEISDEKSMHRHFNSLLFQPRIVGLALLTGFVTQSAVLFFFLGLLLWFNTLIPNANPFERLYDAIIGRRKGFPPLPPAPAPRRFMQGMAGSLMLFAAITLYLDMKLVSYIAQVFIFFAFSLLLFGKFCLGAYIYHALVGRFKFANETLPWQNNNI